MKFCDEKCNECTLLDNRQLSMILNMLYSWFGDDVYKIVQSQCPNLTCCADCRIDDFCHIKGCVIYEDAENEVKRLFAE